MMVMNKQQAQAAAERLASRLGEGYEAIIHENLGWHYKARKGVITVRETIVRNPEHEGFPAHYRATIEPGYAVQFHGASIGLGVQIFANGDTPKEAVENVLRQRDLDCMKLEEIVEVLRMIE